LTIETRTTMRIGLRERNFDGLPYSRHGIAQLRDCWLTA
jgi:hypothetical protein